MTGFASLMLPADPDVVAPDCSDVRILLSLDGGSMAHFSLDPGKDSVAVRHRTVEEIWYITGGGGQMWRRQDGREELTNLVPGLCLTIPFKTSFQFRSTGDEPLTAIAVTMPPWPGEDEAELVEGYWPN